MACGENVLFLYVEAYCKPYRQLMPVEYVKGPDDVYRKKRMACSRYRAGVCDGSDCEHFRKAPESVDEKRLSANLL